MALAIVGLGLVSPFGNTPAEHVFFLRASVPAPPESPFERDGEKVSAWYCRWLGPDPHIPERFARMGDLALASATAALEGKTRTRVIACAGAPRAGLSADDIAGWRQHAGAKASAEGDAGVFAQAAGLAPDRDEAFVLLAVDSFVSPDALDEVTKLGPSPWSMTQPTPSEGAAAIALMNAADARRLGIEIIGTLVGAHATHGKSHDNNREPVDGGAMSIALRQLPHGDPVRSAFGPWRVDSLRHYEWALATCRMSALFRDADFICLESHIGRVGAASGLANLVYGLAMLRHGALRGELVTAPFLAWAISPDGTRGVARATTRAL